MYAWIRQIATSNKIYPIDVSINSSDAGIEDISAAEQ